MNFRKSFVFNWDNKDIAEIDEQLKNLYVEPMILEQKCLDSSLRTVYNNALSKALSPKRNSIDIAYDKSPESVVEGLPDEYFTPKYDPIAPHLIEIGEWEESELLEKFMNKIEEADTDKDVIISHLTTMIESNYDDLLECMTNIQSINVDLCKAGIQISHGRRKIRSASDILYSGAIKVRELNNKRNKFQALQETVRSLKVFKDIHQGMIAHLNTGEVGKAAEHAKHVLECLHHESYDQYIAFANIKTSMSKSIIKIRQKADTALRRLCCRKFSALDYENILTSYVLLDYISETLHFDLHDEDEASISYHFDCCGCIDGLSQRINRYQLEDIDACLHSAVMEYIYASQQKKQKAAAELSIAGAYLQMDMGEIVDLAEVPLKILYRRLTSDMIAPCIVRSCELLVDVVHTHFLATQWHRTPFDKQNLDKMFLHRHIEVDVHSQHQNENNNIQSAKNLATIIDLADEDDESVDTNDEDHSLSERIEGTSSEQLKDRMKRLKKATNYTSFLPDSVLYAIKKSFQSNFIPFLNNSTTMSSSSNSTSNKGVSSTTASSEVLYSSSRLVSVYESLLHSRTLLWEEILRALVSMLSMMNFTSEVKIEDFLSMAWALNSMIDLGKEFCQSDSKALSKSLREKSKEYFHNFHCESFQLLRDMLEAESWHNFPIDLEEKQGILGIIKDVLLRDSARLGMIYFEPSSVSYNFSSTKNKSQDNLDASKTLTNCESDSDYFDTNIPSHSILTRFAIEGNPFHIMTHGADSDNSNINNNYSNKDNISTTDSNSNKNNSNKDNDNNEITNTTNKRMTDIKEVDSQCFWGLLEQQEENEKATNKRHVEQSGMVVTQVALNGLSKYVAKYLLLMYLLPTTSQQIFEQLSILFDYYICAVFNGFIPIEERQKFLGAPTKINAPPPDQSKEYDVLKSYLERMLETEVITSITSNAKSHVLSHTDEEESSTSTHLHDNDINTSETGGAITTDSHSISSPSTPIAITRGSITGSLVTFTSGGTTNTITNNTSNEKCITSSSSSSSSSSSIMNHKHTKMSMLLRPPAIPLHLDTTCMALTERLVATESCYFVAKILVELKAKFIRLVPEEYGNYVNEYITNFQNIVAQLRALLYRSFCPQLIKFNQVLQQILDCGWDSKKPCTEPHDWVQKLATTCERIWTFMKSMDQFADSSSIIREQVWIEVCQCAFDVVLEGFSKARKCSTEGRSAMIMDTFALHDALNQIHICRPPRGKHYIENYLRATSLSEEEIMIWIKENWESHAYRHIHGLLTQSITSTIMNNKKLKDYTNIIDNLYEIKDHNSNSSISNSTSSLVMNVENVLNSSNTFQRRLSSTFRVPSLNIG